MDSSLYFDRPVYAGPTFGPCVPADVANRDAAKRDRRAGKVKARPSSDPRGLNSIASRIAMVDGVPVKVRVFAARGLRESQSIKPVSRDTASGSMAGKGNPTGRDARYAVAARRAVAAMNRG